MLIFSLLNFKMGLNIKYVVKLNYELVKPHQNGKVSACSISIPSACETVAYFLPLILRYKENYV